MQCQTDEIQPPGDKNRPLRRLAPESGFGGEGPVFNQFGIAFAHFLLFFGQSLFTNVSYCFLVAPLPEEVKVF